MTLPFALPGFIPADFHFLRPLWLVALIPAVLFALLLWRRMGAGRSAWQGLVDAHLLRHLALKDKGRAGKWPVVLLLAAWTLAAFAMAGPAWRKLPTPALDRIDPTVIVLSLAQSMNATDQNPTRLAAARHKVDDMLRRMRGGQVGLVIFADAPFVASPLTEDVRVVGQMLPEIATDLMPVMDNRPDMAIRAAVDLLKNTGAPTGRIVLITDGLGDRPDQTRATAAAAAAAGYSVNVLGVGADAPTPLLAFDGRILRARDGTPFTTRLDEAGLRQVAEAGGGSFTPLTVGDRDLDTLFAKSAAASAKADLQNTGLSADQWVDMGPWLLIAVLALAPLAFRRGWIAGLALAVLAAGGGEARAQTTAPSLEQRWRDLWQTPDQQGAGAFKQQDYTGATQSFRDPNWQASALYKDGDYDRAANVFARTPDGDYNRGNALARAGKLEDALKAYDAALKADPENADAIYNRALVQKILDDKNKLDLPQPPQDQKGQGGGGGGSGGGSGSNDQKNPDKSQDKNKNKDKDKDKSDQKQDSAQNKPQDQGKDQKDQKPDGDDQAKAQPKPGQDKPGQDKAGQDKPGQDKQAQQKPEPKPEPAKPEPKGAGNEPAKPEPQKEAGNGQPEPAKPAPGQPGAQPQPAQQQPEAPPQPQPRPADAGPRQPVQLAQPQDGGAPDGDKDGEPPVLLGARPMTEQEQSREQALRMVPDDPMGLLRARIRAHYTGRVVPVAGVDQP